MTGKEHAVRRAFACAMAEWPICDAVAGCREMFVAFSGGADSAALLVLMREYAAEHRISLTAIHVHHGIRGAEADRDALACEAFCRERGIPLLIRRADVPALAKQWSLGLEEAARRVRYEAFDALCGEKENALVATAHSADDNLETVLFHMLRGAGSAGMAGIPPVRGRYIRPLLGCSSSEIRDFCRAEGIPYVSDSTNADNTYTRNYIRNEITPALRKITPAPEKAVMRMSSLLRRDEAFLHQAAVSALGEYAAKTSAPCGMLSDLEDAVLSRACGILYGNAAGGKGDLSAAHVTELCRMIRAGRCDSISLPGSFRARVFDGEIAFLPEKDSTAGADLFHFSLTEGVHSFPEYGFGVCFFADEGKNIPFDKNIYKLAICTSLPFDTIQSKAFVRFRQPGDRYRFGGMTRSVKKLLNEAKIPPEKRDRLPVFCDEAGILWIPGFPVRDGGSADGARAFLACFSL